MAIHQPLPESLGGADGRAVLAGASVFERSESDE
jgi:hypothetical protein